MSEKKENVTDKKISRRSLLKYTGALAAGAIVGVAAEYGASYKPPPPPPPSFKPPLSADVQTRVDAIKQQLIAKHQGEQVFYTSCNQNGCRGSICMLKVHVKDDVITAVESDDTINPNIPRDAYEDAAKMMIQVRPCAMAHAWRKDLYSPTRIIYPMKRVGQRGDFPPNFVRISWDEALDTYVNAIKAAYEKYGPYCIIRPVSLNAAWPFTWYGVGESYTGDVSGGAHDAALEFMMGYRAWGGSKASEAVPTMGAESVDILNAKSIVFWGWSPLNSYTGTHNYIYILAREKGIPIIVIDPRDNMTADTQADQWIPIRPSTDAAMMIAVANVLFKDDSYDKGFVAKYVEPTGFQKWKDYVVGITAGPTDGKIDRTPEWAEKICGVPAETIREFARFLVMNRPAHIVAGLAPGRMQLGENMARGAICLQVMLGSMGVSGGYAGSPQNSSPAKRIPTPTIDYKRVAPTYVPPFLHVQTKWAEAILARQELDQGKITADQFKTRVACWQENPVANIHTALFDAVNSVNQMNDVNKRARAMKTLDFAVMSASQNDINMATTMYCDILLPYSGGFFEEPFGVFNMFYPRFRAADRENNYIMYTQKAVNSRGESRPQLWVNVQLATRLGVIDQYCPILKGVSIDNYNQVAETLHQQAYELWAARADVKDIPGLTVPTWEEFNKKPILRVPIDTTKTYSPTTKNGLMIGLVDQIQNGKPFATKSGKIEFYSDYLATTDLSKTMWGIGPMPPMVQWVVPGSNYAPPPGVQGAPSGDSFWDPNVKNYPLYHMMPAAVFRQHSLHDNNPLLNDQYRHAVWISVPDAKARGIVDNDLVRVYNEVGEMILPAYVTSRIVPGVVCIHSGGWYLPSQVKTNLNPDGIDIRGNCNILTHDYLYPGMSMPGASLVEVQKF